MLEVSCENATVGTNDNNINTARKPDANPAPGKVEDEKQTQEKGEGEVGQRSHGSTCMKKIRVNFQ